MKHRVAGCRVRFASRGKLGGPGESYVGEYVKQLGVDGLFLVPTIFPSQDQGKAKGKLKRTAQDVSDLVNMFSASSRGRHPILRHSAPCLPAALVSQAH